MVGAKNLGRGTLGTRDRRSAFRRPAARPDTSQVRATAPRFSLYTRHAEASRSGCAETVYFSNTSHARRDRFQTREYESRTDRLSSRFDQNLLVPRESFRRGYSIPRRRAVNRLSIFAARLRRDRANSTFVYDRSSLSEWATRAKRRFRSPFVVSCFPTAVVIDTRWTLAFFFFFKYLYRIYVHPDDIREYIDIDRARAPAFIRRLNPFVPIVYGIVYDSAIGSNRRGARTANSNGFVGQLIAIISSIGSQLVVHHVGRARKGIANFEIIVP